MSIQIFSLLKCSEKLYISQINLLADNRLFFIYIERPQLFGGSVKMPRTESQRRKAPGGLSSRKPTKVPNFWHHLYDLVFRNFLLPMEKREVSGETRTTNIDNYLVVGITKIPHTGDTNSLNRCG